jgi:hypothetical protein
MFDPSTASAPVASRVGLRRIWWLATALLLVVLGLVAVLLVWTVERRSLVEELDFTEQETQRVLVWLTRTPPRDAVTDLRRGQKELQRQQRRLERSAAAWGVDSLEPLTRVRYERTRQELGRVLSLLETSRDVMRATPAEKRTDQWVQQIVQILVARADWPISGVVRMPARRLSPRDVGRDFLMGMQLGGIWPYYAGRNVFRADLPFGPLRRAFFPYRNSSAFYPGHLVGIAVVGMAVGYGLCWLGMVYNRASLSYAGLLYFVYLIIFTIAMVSVHWGILS